MEVSDLRKEIEKCLNLAYRNGQIQHVKQYEKDMNTMKQSNRKTLLKLSRVWSGEYFGSRNRNARGKRYSRDGSAIKEAARKFRHNKDWKYE